MNVKILLIAIIFLGVFLRFFMLGSNPPSLNWDEVSTGYNAYSILKTGRDEYGNYLPLSIRSFDDYKPALYTYLTVPAIAAFGLTDFAVRLPSALLGSLTVLIVFFLTRQILSENKFLEKSATNISLLASFFFAISPWSLQFSRAAYEGNIGLFFLLAGILFFFKFLKRPVFLFPAILFFALSMYSYHSFRLIVPIFLLGFVALYFKEFVKRRLLFFLAFGIFILFSAPIYANFLFSSEGAGSRLSMVTIFGDTPKLQKSIERLEYDKKIGNPLGQVFENRRFVYGLDAMRGYLEHYNPGFLFIYGDGGVQHHPVDFGMLYLFSLPFIIIGVYFLCKNFSKRIGVLLFLFLLAPLASSISSGAPHPVRAIIMAPIFDIFFAAGIYAFAKEILKIKYKILNFQIKYVIFSMCFLFFILNVLYYFHQYYIHTPREYGYFWQYGNKEAVKYAYLQKENYDRVIMTYEYDQPYAFYLYHNQIDPKWYQKNWDFIGNGVMPRFERKFDNLEFRDINYGQDRTLENSLLIGTPNEIPEDARIIKTVYFLDGTPAYRIVETGI